MDSAGHPPKTAAGPSSSASSSTASALYAEMLPKSLAFRPKSTASTTITSSSSSTTITTTAPNVQTPNIMSLPFILNPLINEAAMADSCQLRPVSKLQPFQGVAYTLEPEPTHGCDEWKVAGKGERKVGRMREGGAVWLARGAGPNSARSGADGPQGAEQIGGDDHMTGVTIPRNPQPQLAAGFMVAHTRRANPRSSLFTRSGHHTPPRNTFDAGDEDDYDADTETSSSPPLPPFPGKRAALLTQFTAKYLDLMRSKKASSTPAAFPTGYEMAEDLSADFQSRHALRLSQFLRHPRRKSYTPSSSADNKASSAVPTSSLPLPHPPFPPAPYQDEDDELFESDDSEPWVFGAAVRANRRSSSCSSTLPSTVATEDMARRPSTPPPPFPVPPFLPAPYE